MRAGTFLRDLPADTKRVAYNLKYLPEVCEILWHLGQDDRAGDKPASRACDPNSAESCARSRQVSRHGTTRSSWTSGFVCLMTQIPGSTGTRPFDFLSGILEVEGHTTSSTWKTVTWSRFQVTPAFAAPLRKKVVAAILRLLAQGDKQSRLPRREGARECSSLLR